MFHVCWVWAFWSVLGCSTRSHWHRSASGPLLLPFVCAYVHFSFRALTVSIFVSNGKQLTGLMVRWHGGRYVGIKVGQGSVSIFVYRKYCMLSTDRMVEMICMSVGMKAGRKLGWGMYRIFLISFWLVSRGRSERSQREVTAGQLNIETMVSWSSWDTNRSVLNGFLKLVQQWTR